MAKQTASQNPGTPAPAAPAKSPGAELVAALDAAGIQAPNADGGEPNATVSTPAAQSEPSPVVAAPSTAAPAAAVTPTPETTVSADQQQTTRSLLERMGELGFQGVTNEQEGIERLLEAQRTAQQQLQQMQEWARYGQEYAELAQDPDFQKFYAQRQAMPTPVRHMGQGQPASEPTQSNAPPAGTWCPVPDIDLNLVQRYRETKIDPVSGQQITDFKANTPVAIRQQFENWQMGVDQFTTEFTTQPRKVLSGFFEQEAMPRIVEAIRQELAQVTTQQTQQTLSMRIAAENPWIFAKDPRTNQPMVDPVSGQHVLTPEGQQAYNVLSQVRQYVPDPVEAWEMTRARVMVSNPHLVQQYLLPQGQSTPAPTPAPAPAPTPAPVAAQRRQTNYLQNAAAASTTPPNRTGSLSQQGTTQQRSGRRPTPGHDLIETMAAMGVPVN